MIGFLLNAINSSMPNAARKMSFGARWWKKPTQSFTEAMKRHMVDILQTVLWILQVTNSRENFRVRNQPSRLDPSGVIREGSSARVKNCIVIESGIFVDSFIMCDSYFRSSTSSPYLSIYESTSFQNGASRFRRDSVRRTLGFPRFS